MLTKAPHSQLSVPHDSGLSSYLNHVSKTAPLTTREECMLAHRIQKGDKKALDMLVTANLRFVISVARNYMNQGVPVADLINIGNIGLIHAAEKYDSNKNFRFISYAVWWIRQAILTELSNQSRAFRLPLNQIGLIYKIDKTRQKIQQKKSRDPTVQELSNDLGLSPEEIVNTLQATTPHLSLDVPVAHGDLTLHDMVPAENQTCESPSYDISLSRKVENSLAALDEREKEVICLYFGIGTGANLTLKQIGEHLNLTRERVRQIKAQALKKMNKIMQLTKKVEKINLSLHKN